MSPFVIGIIIFIVTFIAIATEKIPRSLAALAGACAMLILQVVHQKEAFLAIDLNVIFLLAGMMMIVHILARSGVFQWIAIKTFHVSCGEPIVALILLSLATALISSVLDNVTTVLLIAPVTIVLLQYLEIDPVPFLILEAIASNIGGAATLIGDPPNILIGSGAGLGFNTFIMNLAPVIAITLICYLITIWIVFRKSFRVSSEVKARIMEIDAKEAITDKKVLVQSLIVLGIVIGGFVLHEPLGFEAATIALGGATLLMIMTKLDPDEVFRAVEWSTLFFYIGLFVVVEGLVSIGAVSMAADKLFALTSGNHSATTLLVLWFSGITCSFLNNIPYVATMIPIIKHVGPNMAAHLALPLDVVMMPLWWALSLGACLGGNGSLIGASANFIIAGVAQKSGYKISFIRFMKYGMVFMLQSLIISTVYLYLRYFFF